MFIPALYASSLTPDSLLATSSYFRTAAVGNEGTSSPSTSQLDGVTYPGSRSRLGLILTASIVQGDCL